MAIFAIGDMHLSLGTDKPMDVFPGGRGICPDWKPAGAS